MKKLTDGVVADNVSWSTDKTSKKTDDLEKPRQQDERPELYSLQESCHVLQISYDDLYVDEDDDDGETSSVRTRISATNSSGGTLSDSLSSESTAAVNDVETSEKTSPVDTGIGDDSSSDSVASPLSDSSTSNSASAVNDVEDGVAMSDSDAASDSDRDEPITSEDDADLYAPEAWESYYNRLQEIGRAMKNREGWPKFDAVFMISAVDGDGVCDIKVNNFWPFF